MELKRSGNCESKLLLRLVTYLDIEVSQGDVCTQSAEKTCELSTPWSAGDGWKDVKEK